MITRKDLLVCAFGLALALTCNKAKADETPDRAAHGGIVASEVHPAPTVGTEEKDAPVTIHTTTRDASCPAGWTLEAGVCLP